MNCMKNAKGSAATNICVVIAVACAILGLIMFSILGAKENKIKTIVFGADQNNDKNLIQRDLPLSDLPDRATQLSQGKGLDDMYKEYLDLSSTHKTWIDKTGFADKADFDQEWSTIKDMTSIEVQPTSINNALQLVLANYQQTRQNHNETQNNLQQATEELTSAVEGYEKYRQDSIDQFNELNNKYITVEVDKETEYNEEVSNYTDILAVNNDKLQKLSQVKQSFENTLKKAARIIIQQAILQEYYQQINPRLLGEPVSYGALDRRAKIVFVDLPSSFVFIEGRQGAQVGNVYSVYDAMIKNKLKGKVKVEYVLDVGLIATIEENVSSTSPIHVNDRLQNIERQIPAITAQVSASDVDGEILEFDLKTQTAYINKGTAQKMEPGLVFSVFHLDPSGKILFKGYVKTVEVRKELSVATVVRLLDPQVIIKKGDKVASPEYPPVKTFIILGTPPEDYPYTESELEYLLRRNGFKVTSELTLSVDYVILFDITKGSQTEVDTWKRQFEDAKVLRRTILLPNELNRFIEE